MARNYIGKIIFIGIILFVVSCRERNTIDTAGTTSLHKKQTKYTCPMHPQIIRDEPGKCPICGMDLVPVRASNQLAVDSSLLPLLMPVNEQVISSITTIKADEAIRKFSVPVQGVVSYDMRKQVSLSSRVAGRIERMYVRYNYQPVTKGQLIMEIYSPDLSAAQREMIYISKNDNNSYLLQKARQRLLLLGMQLSQIMQVERSGKPLYRVPVFSTVSGYIIEKKTGATNPVTTGKPPANSPVSGEMGGMGSDQPGSQLSESKPIFKPSPVLIREGQYVNAGETIFTVYQANNMVAEFSFTPELASQLHPGQKLVFYPVSNPKDIKAVSIGLIEPVQKNGQGFTIARVFLTGTNLQAGQLVTANIPVSKTGAAWLPEKAVLRLGNKSIVFKKENQVFIPKEVREGFRIQGLVQILTDISDWQIAGNASFLVDNESFIRLRSNQK